MVGERQDRVEPQFPAAAGQRSPPYYSAFFRSLAIEALTWSCGVKLASHPAALRAIRSSVFSLHPPSSTGIGRVGLGPMDVAAARDAAAADDRVDVRPGLQVTASSRRSSVRPTRCARSFASKLSAAHHSLGPVGHGPLAAGGIGAQTGGS